MGEHLTWISQVRLASAGYQTVEAGARPLERQAKRCGESLSVEIDGGIILPSVRRRS